MPNDGTNTCPGHSVIYDPDGHEIARSKEGEEQLLIADIPLHQLLQKKGKRVHGSLSLTEKVVQLTYGGIKEK